MSEVRLNAYRIMWLFVMFDLPTQTKVDKKNSARFRKDLEKDGFIMHQWSRSNSQNWTWNNRLVPNQERSLSRLYIVTLLI